MMFSKKIREIIEICSLTAKKEDIRLFFIGGIVRDFILKKEIKDIDITVEADAIKFAHKLPEAEIISTHPDFGSVKVRFKNGIEVDFASTREETYPFSGCLPVVKNIGCDISKDLKRRDFTVNSIAMNLDFVFFDPFEGKKDIENKVLRVLHDKSFIDDPTRILRGMDFKHRFGFKFDEETEKLKREYLKNPDRSGLSISRVELTLKKLFSVNSAEIFDEFIEEKIYRILRDDVKCKSLKKFGGEKIKNAIEIFKPEEVWKVYYQALDYKPLCRNFKNNFEIYNFFKNFDNIELALYYATTSDRNAIEFYKELKNIKPEINGNDLKNLGFQEGKAIGEILNKILEKKLNGEIKNKNDEINFSKNYTKV